MPFFQLSSAKGMEDATHAPDEPLNNDRSNQCALRAPSGSSPQGARPALATHLQPDNKKSSRTNSNFSISSLIKRPRRQSVITKNVEGVLYVSCIILFLTDFTSYRNNAKEKIHFKACQSPSFFWSTFS